jgi:hypothetical protein
VVTGILMLSLVASAEAISKPIAIGSNSPSLPSAPAVAVDSTGTAYTAWLNPPADTKLTFCKVSIAAPRCAPVSLPDPDPSHAQYFDPPSVLVAGTTVRVFEEVDGAANQNQNGMYEWVSTDGGATFAPFPYALSYTAVGDTAGTQDPRVEVRERVHPTAGATARWASAISSRTAWMSPSRNSSMGSGSPLTIDSKNCLRSW